MCSTLQSFALTVHDNGYSSRSVVTIAKQVVQSDTESAAAKAFCQQKILDNMA